MVTMIKVMIAMMMTMMTTTTMTMRMKTSWRIIVSTQSPDSCRSNGYRTCFRLYTNSTTVILFHLQTTSALWRATYIYYEYSDTRTYTHTYPNSHAHTHTHIHTHLHAPAHACTDARTDTHTQTHTHTHIHTNTHIKFIDANTIVVAQPFSNHRLEY